MIFLIIFYLCTTTQGRLVMTKRTIDSLIKPIRGKTLSFTEDEHTITCYVPWIDTSLYISKSNNTVTFSHKYNEDITLSKQCLIHNNSLRGLISYVTSFMNVHKVWVNRSGRYVPAKHSELPRRYIDGDYILLEEDDENVIINKSGEVYVDKKFIDRLSVGQPYLSELDYCFNLIYNDYYEVLGKSTDDGVSSLEMCYHKQWLYGQPKKLTIEHSFLPSKESQDSTRSKLLSLINGCVDNIILNNYLENRFVSLIEAELSKVGFRLVGSNNKIYTEDNVNTGLHLNLFPTGVSLWSKDSYYRRNFTLNQYYDDDIKIAAGIAEDCLNVLEKNTAILKPQLERLFKVLDNFFSRLNITFISDMCNVMSSEIIVTVPEGLKTHKVIISNSIVSYTDLNVVESVYLDSTKEEEDFVDTIETALNKLIVKIKPEK